MVKVFAVLSWDSGFFFFFSSPLPQLSLVIPSCSHTTLNLGPVLPSSFDMMYIGPGAYSFSFALVTDSQIASVSINKTRCSPTLPAQAPKTSILNSCLARVVERKSNTKQMCVRWKHWGRKRAHNCRMVLNSIKI